MKKISYFFLASAIAILMASCTEKEQEIRGTGHGYDEATLTVAVDSLGNTGVKVAISCIGVAGAPYYGFFTDDVTSPASALVAEKLKGISVSRHILSTGETVARMKGIRAGGKAYRYIATGLTASGDTYNDPVSVEFETPGNYATGSLNITVANITAQKPTFSISGVDGYAAYAVLEKSVVESFASEKVLFNSLFDEIEELAVVDADEASCKWSKLEPGDYVVYALGFKEDEKAIEGFQPSLIYSKAEFTVEPVTEPEPEYLAYIGTWYDAEGNEYTISQKDINATYTMTGLDADIEVLYVDKGIKFSGENELGTTTDGLSIYLFGIDSDGYAEDASQNDADPYILASGVMENNKISITGSEYEAVYDKETYDEIIVGLVVYAYDDSTGKIYKLSDGDPKVLAIPVSLSKEKPGDNPSDTYSKYLGEWTITRGEATDTWTISVKEDGVSYNIDGIEGYDASKGMTVEGKFENNQLVVYTQTLGTWQHSNYGTIEDHLMGNVVVEGKKYRISGDYMAFTGALNAAGDAIELTPGVVNIPSLGGELTLAGIQFYGILTDEGENQGAALYYNADYTTLPNTLTKVGGGETSNYSKYIGEWTITRGEATDTWTISVKEDGVSYNIDGIEGLGASNGMTVEGKFENNQLVVYTQTLGTWQHNSYGTVENHLMGNVVVSEKKYRISGDYMAFTGALNAAGDAIELTPGVVNIPSLGGELTLAGIQFYGILTDEGENQGAALYFNADYTTLPNTLTFSTSGTSSVSIDMQASARLGGLSLAGSNTKTLRLFSNDKCKGNLEKSSEIKAEKNVKGAAPLTRGIKKTIREEKGSSIIAGHKA